MKRAGNPKLCLACSVGGHLTQLLQLQPFFSKFEHFFITEDTRMTREMAKTENVKLVKLINRKKKSFPLLLIYNSTLSLIYLIREKPDVIISTGALSAVPVCYIGKLLGTKVVFIESYAKVTSPTLSGKLVYKVADLFIVQWEELRSYYPNAVYGGSIY